MLENFSVPLNRLNNSNFGAVGGWGGRLQECHKAATAKHVHDTHGTAPAPTVTCLFSIIWSVL